MSGRGIIHDPKQYGPRNPSAVAAVICGALAAAQLWRGAWVTGALLLAVCLVCAAIAYRRRGRSGDDQLPSHRV